MDDVVFGYVYDFGTGEEWTATRGGGAFLNGAPIVERPKDELEILSFEATTTAYVSENAARFDGVAAPPARDGLARDHALPPRRRPRRRRRLAEGGAVGRHRRCAAARPGAGFAIDLPDEPPFGSAPLDLTAARGSSRRGTTSSAAGWRTRSPGSDLQPATLGVVADARGDPRRRSAG